MGQMDFGDVWEAGDLIVCSCAARGPVLVHDRPLGDGLTERRCVCKGCGAETLVSMSPPTPRPRYARRQVEAPLLWMLGVER